MKVERADAVKSIVFVYLLVFAGIASPVRMAAQRGTNRNSASAVSDLRALGSRLVKAVLSRDIATILSVDDRDLRANDAQDLKDQRSDLYCYLFDASCSIVKPSVYDILSKAKRLDVDVQLIQQENQPLHAWLLFFDAAVIRKSDLRSPTFLCDHSSQVASWLFKLEGAQWTSANPPFDAETDTKCPPK